MKAQEIRSNANQDNLAVICASFPHPEQITPRGHFDASWALEKIPASLDRRMDALTAKLDKHRQELAADIRRYTDLLTRKLDALSDYDLTICHQGDVEQALLTALGLKTAHISWQRSHIQVLEAELATMERDRPQLALF